MRRGVWLLTLALLIAGAAGVLALRLALRGAAAVRGRRLACGCAGSAGSRTRARRRRAAAPARRAPRQRIGARSGTGSGCGQQRSAACDCARASAVSRGAERRAVGHRALSAARNGPAEARDPRARRLRAAGGLRPPPPGDRRWRESARDPDVPSGLRVARRERCRDTAARGSRRTAGAGAARACRSRCSSFPRANRKPPPEQAALVLARARTARHRGEHAGAGARIPASSGPGCCSAGSASCRGSRRSSARVRCAACSWIAWLFSVAYVLAVFPWFASGIAAYTGTPTVDRVRAARASRPLLQPQLLVYAAVRRLLRSDAGVTGLRAALAGALLYVGAEWAWPKLLGDTIGHGLVRGVAHAAGGRSRRRARAHVRAAARQRVRASGGAGARDGAHAVARAAAARERAGCLRRCARARARGLWRAAPRPAARAGPSRRRCSRPASSRPTSAATASSPASSEPTTRRARSSTRTSRSRARLLARAPLDLLVWPETVYPTTFGTPKTPEGARARRRDRRASSRARRCRSSSAPTTSTRATSSTPRSSSSRPESGRLEFETYRKASLFPLTERVPALLESERVRRWLPWLGTWKPGAGAQVTSLALADGRRLQVAPLICYDAVTPTLAIEAVRAGAELIVTLSNDAWFATGEGPHLHLVGVGLPQPRDAPAAAARHQHRHLRRDRRGRASCSRRPACTSARRS